MRPSAADSRAKRTPVATPATSDQRGYRLSSVARALEALEVIAAAPRPLPAKAVAQQLGTSTGTAYHVLNTLEDAGYVVRLTRGCWGLGPKVASLHRGFNERIDVMPDVRSLVTELAERAVEDAYLAVLREGAIAVVDVAEGSRSIHVDGLEVGFTRIAHTTAIGKVLLAGAPEADVEGYLGEHELKAFTRRTLTERRHIRRHLRVVRERGVGNDLEELVDGCCCVAVPVLDAAGRTVGAIGISTTTQRWRAEHTQLTELCREVGSRASLRVAGS